MKITQSYLAAIYKKHGVKRKTIKLVKTLPKYLAQKVPTKLFEMRSEICAALEEGRKLVFADEAMFTTAGRLTHAYSVKNQNIMLDEKSCNVESMAVVAGISREDGLESFFM